MGHSSYKSPLFPMTDVRFHGANLYIDNVLTLLASFFKTPSVASLEFQFEILNRIARQGFNESVKSNKPVGFNEPVKSNEPEYYVTMPPLDNLKIPHMVLRRGRQQIEKD